MSNLAWRFRNQAAETAEIEIYDLLGEWGLTLKDFTRELAQVKARRLRVSIHSDGGNAMVGLSIYNALREWPGHVATHVLFAASAASVIACGGARVTIAEAGSIMIHEPNLGTVVGDAEDLTKAAKMAETVANLIAAVYVAKAGGTVPEWRARMKAETWYNAREAVAVGLADSIEVVAAPLAAQIKMGLRLTQRDRVAVYAMAGARAAHDFIDAAVQRQLAATVKTAEGKAAVRRATSGPRRRRSWLTHS